MLSLNWHQHNSNLKAGFTNAQQTGDYVDLTVAADGHLVKVHQLILGTASPYIKSLIDSATCKHPVIFLTNISYETLCSLLEYMYAGEVVISEDNLDQFLNAAKALRIKGLDVMDVNLDITSEQNDELAKQPAKETEHELQIQMLTDESVPIEQQPVPTTSCVKESIPGQTLKRKCPEKPNESSKQPELSKNKKPANDILEPAEDIPNTSEDLQDDDDDLHGKSLADLGLAPIINSANQEELQYTVSTRGALQLILNRFIYNIFSKRKVGNIRRWRCVDYRDHKCPACAVTSGNVVIRRTNLHNHPFHDKKIMLKLERKAIYSAIASDETKTE